MNVVILRTGLAVKTSNIQNPINSIDGLLSTFEFEGKKYSFFNKSIFETSDKKTKLNTAAGYYEIETYSKYILNPTSEEYKDFNNNFNFNHKFIYADQDEPIEIKVVYIGEPPIGYYYYRTYNFTNTKSKNYLKENTSELDLSLMGNPSQPVQIIGTSLQNSFYDRHISKLSVFPVSEKFRYSLITVKSTARIGMIVRDIFPILLYNPSNAFNLTNVSALIESMKSNWENNDCYDNFTLNSAILHYEHLTYFYTSCFKYQELIKKSNEEDRIIYTLQILPLAVINSLVPNSILINALRGVSNKNKIEENDINTTVKILMSFEEATPSKIDEFLDFLLNEKVSISPVRCDENVIKFHIRDKITLYESIYLRLKTNKLYNLWQYSPLYKKIHASLNLEEKASSLQIFVTSVYTLWVKSKYNPYRNNLFNENYIGYLNEPNQNIGTFKYTREPASIFYFPPNASEITDTIVRENAPMIINVSHFYIYAINRKVDAIRTQFALQDKILVETYDIRNAKITGTPSPGIEHKFNYFAHFFSYGYYNIYQPVQVIDIKSNEEMYLPVHSWDENGQTVSQTFMPIFLFHFFQEKEENEFIYSLIWELIQAGYEGLPANKYTKLIDEANKGINYVLDILNNALPDNVFHFLTDFANSCNSNDDFCILVKRLDTWIQNYVAVKNNVVYIELQKSAENIVKYAQTHSWSSEFENSPIGLSAKNFIIDVANINIAGLDDRKNDILLKIKNRVNKEEPEGNTTTYQGFSLFKWNLNTNGIYVRTNIRLHNDVDILDMITYGLNNNVQDHWIEGIITKAFRISKTKTKTEVETELLNASNLLKPLPPPGRNNLLYCFHDDVEQNIFENKIKEQYIDKYGIFDIISESNKLVNTYYGGSIHTKTNPPDLDMVSYISTSKMIALSLKAKQVLDEALNNKENGIPKPLISEDYHDALINRINKYITPSSHEKDKNNIRVMSSTISVIVTENSTKKLHFMSEEYRNPNMNVTINGVNKNILNHLNLSSPLSNKFDFVFITKTAAQNGRSIPPETLVTF